MNIDPATISILLALLVQTAVATFWAGGVSSNVRHLQEKVSEIDKKFDTRYGN